MQASDLKDTLSGGNLEKLLKRGKFVLTAETTPPDSADRNAVLERVSCLNGLADAVNVLDAPSAQTHLSPLATAAIMVAGGLEPILQFTMRDRNRLALEADVLGAAALGIHNILCLTGDAPEKGDQPDAKPVYDIGSAKFMEIVKKMRHNSVYPSERPIEIPPRIFIGGADAPKNLGTNEKAVDLQKKIDAGANFFQTQYCFDMRLLRSYMSRLSDLGIIDRTYFIIGIGPISSAKSARWMNKNLYGVSIPEVIIKRLEKAKDSKLEGRKICVELIHELQEMEGISGAHLMAPNGELAAAEVIQESGVISARL